MVYLIIGLIMWLACGALGSYLGHLALQRIFSYPATFIEYCGYIVVALGGPINLAIVYIMFY